MFRQYLHHVRQALTRVRQPRPKRRPIRRPQLEVLEERALLSILFGDTPGLTTSDYAGPVINHAHVELVFWGNGWNTGSGPAQRTNLTNAVASILSGPYTHGLDQYRGSLLANGSLAGSVTTIIPSPPSSRSYFSSGDVTAMLGVNIAAGILPNPSSDPNRIYFVFAQPGSYSSSDSSLHGSDHGYSSFLGTTYQYGWSSGYANLDGFTRHFSREIIGTITDPRGTGIQVNPRDPINWNDLDHGEAANYQYRLNNVLVQPWWSQNDHKFIVPTSQAQNFLVSHGSVLTVNGDQLPNHNDTITIDETPGGGVQITLNGEIAKFEISDIVFIVVNSGGGTDTINVHSTPVPVDVQSAGNTTVKLGNAGSVQDIWGKVTITNPLSYTAIQVDDSTDSAPRTVKLDSQDIFLDGTYGIISGLAPAQIEYRKSDTSSVSIRSGNVGGNTFNVLATVVPTALVGNANNTTVNVGDAGSVQQIAGALTITDPPLGALVKVNVDDSADSFHTVTLDTVMLGNGPYGRIHGLAPADIRYKYADTSSLTVQTGLGGPTVNVKATDVPTALVGHSSNTAVNVGDAGSVQNILSPLTITNPPDHTALTVDDTADVLAKTVTLSVTNFKATVAGLAPAPISWMTPDVSSVTVNASGSGNTFQVQSTQGGPVTLNTGSGDDAIILGDAANTLDGIAGTLSVNGQGGTNSLTVNDQGSSIARLFTVNAASFTCPAGGTVAYGAVNSLTFNGGSGGNTFNVANSSAATVLTLNAGNGVNTVMGSSSANVWTIYAADTGYLTGPAYGSTVSFNSVGNLTGGLGDDQFAFEFFASVSGNIDGQGGTNTLDYSGYYPSVTVNLQTHVATGVGGAISNIQNVIGGSGGLPGSYNLLVGNGGDVLIGGNGRRNILIAGSSASTLIGGDDQDLLIGGTTIYDTNAAQLAALVAEWVRLDEDYGTCCTNLITGAGVPLLNATTVTGNGGNNGLAGNGNNDLFFANSVLDATDYDSATETLVAL